MRTLGTTVDGNYIVEMTADEHWSFVKVEASINNAPFDMVRLSYPKLNGTNLAPIFNALDDLFDAKTSINRLKEYINFLDNALGGHK